MLNVRGLNSSRKRRAILRQLHIKKYSIIFLQASHMMLVHKSKLAKFGRKFVLAYQTLAIVMVRIL